MRRPRGLAVARDSAAGPHVCLARAHAALLGIFSSLAKPGDTLLCENVTIPVSRSIAAQLGLKLIGLPMDATASIPSACGDAASSAPKALYLNPTLQNPTTLTIPEERRSAIVALARRFKLPIIEDDAYGFIPEHGRLRPSLPSRPISPGTSPASPNASARVRAQPTSWRPSARSGWPFAAALACRERDGLAADRGARHTLDRGRHGRHDPALHPRRDHGATNSRVEDHAQGIFRADPLSFNLWVPTETLDSFGAFVGHRG